MPPPEPRSRTVSPSCRSAMASGLPQPRLAATASPGSWSCSSAAYSSEPVPVSSGALPVSPHVATPPSVTAAAAAAYRARTRSRTSSSSSGLVTAVSSFRSGRRAADEGAQAGQGLGTGAVVDPDAAFFPVQQPGVVQHLQVVADGRLGQAEILAQVTH